MNKKAESASSKPLRVKGESTDKRGEQCLDLLKRKSKTCLIQVPRNSSDECNFLGDFSAKYSKGKPTEVHGDFPIPGNIFNIQMENNAIINNVVDNILLNETQKLSAAMESPEFLNCDCDENHLYYIEK